MSSSDSTLGASSKRPVLYWWLTLLVVLMVSAIASPRTKSSGDTHDLWRRFLHSRRFSTCDRSFTLEAVRSLHGHHAR